MGSLSYRSPPASTGGDGGAELLDGWVVPNTGGGVDGASLGLDIDFRNVTPIDLNAPDTAFVDQGVTWRSSETLDPAVDAFAIDSTGLASTVGANTRFTNTAQDCPHIWTRLQEIPGFSSAEELLIMIFFSALSVSAVNELVFVGNYAPNGDSGDPSKLPLSDARAISNSFGFVNGAIDTIRLLEGLATTSFVGAPSTTNVLAMRLISGAALQFMVGEMQTVDGELVFPRPSELDDVGPFLAAANNSFEDEMWSNQEFNRIAFGFNQENLSAAMSGTIQRARIMIRG